jgi:hypothetical protein
MTTSPFLELLAQSHVESGYFVVAHRTKNASTPVLISTAVRDFLTLAASFEFLVTLRERSAQ